MKNLVLFLLVPALAFAYDNTSDTKNQTTTDQATTEKSTSDAESSDSDNNQADSDAKTNDDATKSQQDTEQTQKADDQAKTDTNDNKTEEDMNNTTDKTQDSATAFMTENAKQDGVVTLSEGLQYKVLEEGTGPKPNMHSSVTVHYEGKLLDGKEFDSSFKRNEPATFNLDQVIQGWTEALPHMQTGSTWLVYIAPELAYGEKGIPGIIPPNSVLVFKIKLIKVNS